MRIRHAVLLGVVVLLGVGVATTAQGQKPAGGAGGTASSAESENTDPHVRPAYGQPDTTFTLTFTLRESAGHEGVLSTDYRVEVTPPQSGTSCAPPQPAPIESGTAGTQAEIRLPSPPGGWCRGTYAVTVYLQRGPYCPPPQQGAQPTPCPEFATQDLETGSTAFTVGPAGAHPRMVAVPKLLGLRPRAADRRLRRRHLRHRYTALSNLCAGLPPHGRIVRQQPGPGARVPRGTRVLLQTSCG